LAGYAKRTIKLDFADLSEPGDEIYIAIRNPRLVPPGELRGKDIALDDNGTPVNPAEAEQAMYETLAKLVVSWHVYDATDLSDEQAVLPLPAAADDVAKLPTEIINRLAEEIQQAANPH
jgi:hypothetical protein